MDPLRDDRYDTRRRQISARRAVTSEPRTPSRRTTGQRVARSDPAICASQHIARAPRPVFANCANTGRRCLHGRKWLKSKERARGLAIELCNLRVAPDAVVAKRSHPLDSEA